MNKSNTTNKNIFLYGIKISIFENRIVPPNATNNKTNSHLNSILSILIKRFIQTSKSEDEYNDNYYKRKNIIKWL